MHSQSVFKKGLLLKLNCAEMNIKDSRVDRAVGVCKKQILTHLEKAMGSISCTNGATSSSAQTGEWLNNKMGIQTSNDSACPWTRKGNHTSLGFWTLYQASSLDVAGHQCSGISQQGIRSSPKVYFMPSPLRVTSQCHVRSPFFIFLVVTSWNKKMKTQSSRRPSKCPHWRTWWADIKIQRFKSWSTWLLFLTHAFAPSI